jgi:methylase of polypeptide subunit release factors
VGAVEPLHAPYYLHHRLRDTDPQAALIRLFLLQQPVPEAELRPAFGLAETTLLSELGLAVRQSDMLTPQVDLYPYRSDWFVTDRRDVASGRADAVMPLNRSSHLLAQLVLAGPVDTVLDIGTGCGIHAIRAARRAHHVVATDLNPRALAFAAFNAALNGVENIEFRQGSLWEPVGADCFDLIVANPAFTLSADTTLLYRDGGARGDRMTAALLAGATEHLREGGVAQVIGEFPTIGDQGFEEQVEGWVGEAPCDRLLLRFGVMEPLEYATTYAHEPFGQTRAEYDAALSARLAELAAHRIRDVVLGAVVLRRLASSSARWAVQRVLPEPQQPVGSDLVRLIALLDRWAAGDSERLLEGIPHLVTGLRLTETRHWQTEEWEADAAIAVAADNPLCQEVRLSPPARDLLALCDGTRSGAEIAADFARGYELEAEEALEVTAAFLRELAEQWLIDVEENDMGGAVARGE